MTWDGSFRRCLLVIKGSVAGSMLKHRDCCLKSENHGKDCCYPGDSYIVRVGDPTTIDIAPSESKMNIQTLVRG